MVENALNHLLTKLLGVFSKGALAVRRIVAQVNAPTCRSGLASVSMQLLFSVTLI